ncbi:MAG TPA: uroporphyrinogen-III synthase [Burkholderiales bacterium]|nr:uroporphyrinogen-III synthase [Burkholderiales bacterium]
MSLAGRGIVVTRPARLAGGLAGLIERAGGRAIVFPAIEIEGLAATGPAGPVDDVIFVSPSAVEMGAAWIGAGERTFALGQGTRAALASRGCADALAPAAGADSEALLALPALAEVRARRIVIVRGEGGRELLGDALAARGAEIRYVQCYRRVPPRADAAALIAAWDAGRIDAVTVNSSAALENLIALLGERLRAAPLFVPHPRVAEQAAAAGVREVLLAGPSDGEMLERLVAYFSRERAPDASSP